MTVGQKLAILKIRTVAFMTHGDLEAAPEETMEFTELIKDSN